MIVKYSNKIPPIYVECRKKFGVSWDQGITMAYDETIYSKYPIIDKGLKIHEETHLYQQKEYGGAKQWWDRYFEDKQFRLQQEVEAYQAQLKYAEAEYTHQRFVDLRKKLVSDMVNFYGDMCTRSEATKLLMSDY